MYIYRNLYLYIYKIYLYIYRISIYLYNIYIFIEYIDIYININIYIFIEYIDVLYKSYPSASTSLVLCQNTWRGNLQSRDKHESKDRVKYEICECTLQATHFNRCWTITNWPLISTQFLVSLI